MPSQTYNLVDHNKLAVAFFDFLTNLVAEPLCEEKRVLLNNSTNHRLWVVAEYALRWQAMDWDRERAVPFLISSCKARLR